MKKDCEQKNDKTQFRFYEQNQSIINKPRLSVIYPNSWGIHFIYLISFKIFYFTFIPFSLYGTSELIKNRESARLIFRMMCGDDEYEQDA